MLKITVLGSATTMPTKERNHPAVHLQYLNNNMLFDCGEGTQRQMINAGLSIFKTGYIFITHLHADHLLGLFGLIQSMAFLGKQENLVIAGPKGIKRYVEFAKKWDYFSPSYKINAVELTKDKTVVEEQTFRVRAFKVEHSVPCFAYVFEEKTEVNLDKAKLKKQGIYENPICKELKEKGKIKFNGKIINLKDVAMQSRKPMKVVYCMDTNPIGKISEEAKDANALICEATFSDKDKEKGHEYGHMTAKDAARIAKNAEVGKLIITHFSPRYDNINVLKMEARNIFRNTEIAEDLDVYEI